MNGRRANIGLYLLCALVTSAFVAQGANGATKGTTAFTCSKEAAVKDFVKEHCKAGDVGTKEYGHSGVPENASTQVSITNEKTSAETNGATLAKLKSTIAGSAIELVATGATGIGTAENRKGPSGEHFVQAFTSTEYTGVKENLLGCKVTGKPGGVGTVETSPLATTTAGQGDSGKLTPEAGTVFAEFELTECAIGPTTVKVVGSIACKPNGATIVCSHEEVTASNTLRLGSAVGPRAGVEVNTTVKGKAAGDSSFTPLSATTVETP